MGKLVFVWVLPRGRSTALLRALTNKPNTKGYFEPITYSFYSGPGSPIQGNPVADAFFENEPDWSVENVLARIQEDLKTNDVIVKDFGWHAINFIDKLPEDAKHVFLIRHPAYVGVSVLNLMSKAEPGAAKAFLDFCVQAYTANGAIYSSLLGIYQQLAARGQQPLVIDSTSFVSKPKESIAKISEYAGLEFSESQLTWESLEAGKYPDNWVYPRSFPKFDRIFNWVTAAMTSTGISANSEIPLDAIPWDQIEDYWKNDVLPKMGEKYPDLKKLAVDI